MWGAKPKETKDPGKKEVKDIVADPIKDKTGKNFGVGFGLGHVEI